MSRWEEIMATTSASCPSVIPDTLMVKGREIFSCLMGKWSRPPSPHDSTKCSLFCGGPHPGVLWSATVWFITQRKGTHLTYRREPKQLSYRQNTPSDMSPTVICSLFISSCVECNTVDSQESSSQEPCERWIDRGVLCCRGHSPLNVNQISCRYSWINDLHQRRTLTVNILIPNPTPTLAHCTFSVFVLQSPPLRARCGWRFLNSRGEKCMVFHRSVSGSSCRW